MNLVDLIVTACLLAHPTVCKDHHIMLQSQGSLRSCVYNAQLYLARWAGEHPGLKIVRWSCAGPNQEGEGA
jgi:hypothetical protein